MSETLELRIANLAQAIEEGKLFGADTADGNAFLDELVDVLDLLDDAAIEMILEWAALDVAAAKASIVMAKEQFEIGVQCWARTGTDSRVYFAASNARKTVSRPQKPSSGSITAPPGRSVDLLNRVDYRLAEAPEEKEEIYRLRYRAYLREGAIQPSADQRVTDDFDNSPYSWIFGVYIDHELCSSIRISVATPEHPTSPSVEVFPDILRPELARGRTLVDPTRFVADPERAKRFPELPYATVRLSYVAGVHFNADLGLATVRAEHRAFYKRIFLQEPLCEPRLFPGLLKPVGLMAAHYPTVREKVFARYPYLHSSAFERRMLFQRGQEKGYWSEHKIERYQMMVLEEETHVKGSV